MFFFVIKLIIFCALLYGVLRLKCNPLLAFYAHFFLEKSVEKLKNKTVWLIGASTVKKCIIPKDLSAGIGEELAYRLAELNCRLILTSRTENKLEEVKQKCLERSNHKLKSDDILVIAYDVVDFQKNDEAFQKIIEKFGNIDIVVTNAARIMISIIPDESLDQTKQLFDVNYFAPVYIIRLVVKHWLGIKSKGQIIATSSMASYHDFPFYSTYIATKRSLNAFCRDVSHQCERNGIFVSLIMPGPTDTELLNKSIKMNGKLASFGKKPWLMSSKTTCEYMIIAMANKLNESWITFQPILLFTYISDIFHYQIHYFGRLINISRLFEKEIIN